MLAQCPKITFTTTKATYCQSDFMDFTALNVPTGSTLSWDIGSGWVAGSTNFLAGPIDSGYHNVILRVILANAVLCTYDSTRIVYINPLPNPSFVQAKNVLCDGPDEVELTDLTKNIKKRTWLINSDAHINVPPKAKIPFKLGTSSITLLVEDSFGCRNSITRNYALTVLNDIDLDITKSDQNNCAPVTTNFDFTANLAGQVVTSYFWDLPGSNKTRETGSSVSGATYSSFGNFFVGLTVTTSNGCIYEKVNYAFMTVGDTAAINVTTSKTELCLSEPVRFTVTRQPLDGTFSWDIPSVSRIFDSKYSGNFTFRDTGNFTLKLTYNHYNCNSTITKTDFIHISGQKASFRSSNAYHCETPHTVNLINTSDTISSTISSYNWTISDSKTGTVLSTSSLKDFTIGITQNPSVYDVRLITTSASGCKDTALLKEFIYIRPYQFNFFATPNIGCIGQKIVYTNNTPSSSYYGLDLFSWDFLNSAKTITLGSSAAKSPSFYYPTTGYFHTKLTAANPLGCQQIKILDSAVQIVDPKLALYIPDSVFCANSPIALFGNSTPKHPVFEHTYQFTHKQSNTVYTFKGDSISEVIPIAGEYNLKYHYGTSTACEDTLIKTIYINGIDGEIVLDSSSGCGPLVVKPTFKVNFNSHLGSTNKTMQYNWDITPKTGATILGAATATPYFVLNADLDYTITVYVSNSTGCGFYSQSKPITVGVKASLLASKLKCCIGENVVLTNASKNNPNIIIWKVLTSKSYQLDSTGEFTKLLTLKDTGDYTVKLVVKKGDKCSDSAFVTIQVTSLKADFKLQDTALGCAPALAKFINKSTNADSLYWDFGDNSKANSLPIDTTKYTYTVNSSPSGYSVRLIAASNFGCRDTIQKNGLVKLIGPIADFAIVNGKGCEPNRVVFVNKSLNFDTSFFYYGENLGSDTNKITAHTYLNTTNVISRLESPSIRVVDKKGCSAELQKVDSIQTNKVPVIKLDIEYSDIYCQRQIIKIADTGRHATNWQWKLNSTIISALSSDVATLQNDGINELELIAYNPLCSDTATRNILAQTTTNVSFTYPKTICVDKLTTIIVNDSLTNPPLRYRWDMGEPANAGNIQTTTTNKINISYRTPGLKKVKLLLYLANGCTVSDSTDLVVFNSDDILTLEMLYAQFNEQNKIEAVYPDLNLSYLQQINMYRNSDFIRSDTTTGITSIVDSTFSTLDKNCYNLSITDQCGVEGDKGRTHCPIYLNASVSKPRQVQLDWTYYIGWDEVSNYIIYRQAPGKSFLPIDTIFSTQKSYIDSLDVCPLTYRYKVVAADTLRKLAAQSNHVSITPFIDKNNLSLLLDNVSVLTNEKIGIRWSPSLYKYNNKYLLTKHAGSLTNIVDSIWVQKNTLRHEDVKNITPQKYSYYYKLHQVDNCDVVSPPTKYMKTIFLQGENTNLVSQIVWDPYEIWEYPTVAHRIEYISATSRTLMAELPADKFSFTDPNFYEDYQGYYLYQVHSINQNGDTSYSNVAYVTGDGKVYSPNAFSPNNDGINDVFHFRTLFITSKETSENKDFIFKIYNRWGEKVFESYNLYDGWDGVYKGQKVGAGVYQYNVKFTDGKGVIRYRSGVIHVLH
jgi:gliding motility-associated-like protein